MILVTTAGKVGSKAVRLLGERDATVRVLVRNPARVTALAATGAETIALAMRLRRAARLGLRP